MIYKPASISPDFRPRRMALMLCGFLLVSTIFSPPGGADKPTTKALVTDKAKLPLSDQFAPPAQIRLTNSGDVFFNPGISAFFQWSSGSGSRTRLLQAGDITLQASLNDSGAVAFLAQLQGGSAPFGWFLGSGAAPPIKIAL